MEHLTPLDDTFLVLERDVLPMHIGSLLIFEGTAPDYDDLLSAMEGRLDQLPRYRQVIRSVPLNLGPPAWVDDQHFHLPYHLRHTAVPAPGDDEQLRTLAGRLLSQRLDLHRPPWEMWLIEGLAGNRFAILNKVHHAMVDGISGSDLMEALLDDAPDVAPTTYSTWRPQSEPGTVRQVADAVVDGVRQPVQRLNDLGSALLLPATAARSAASAVVGMFRLGRTLAHTEEHLLGQPGPHRRWSWALGDLDDVKQVKNSLGGTVNDVILTAIAGGFREFLLGRGVKLTRDDFVRTMVPVSTRAPGSPTGGNDVAVVFTDLPVGIEDAHDRLMVVRQRMTSIKRSGLLEGTDALIENAVFVPPALLAAAGKLAAHAPQPMVSTITTNVPGPQRPLYLRGRLMTRMLPYVPLGMNQLITVAIISYNGALTCGVTADYDRVPDVDVLAEGIESSLAELVTAAAAGVVPEQRPADADSQGEGTQQEDPPA